MRFHSKIRSLFAPVAVVALLLALGTSGYADTPFPDHALTLYVPYPGGSVADIEARALAQGLHGELHQPVTVIDAPGANNEIALNDLEAKPADGYSMILVVTNFAYLLADPKATYKADAVSAVARLTGDAQALYVGEKSPFKTLPEFVQYAKAHPNALSVAGTDTAGIGHDTFERFVAAAGVKIKYIPYNGGTTQLAAVLGGHVDAGLVSASNVIPNAQGHILRILALSAGGAYRPMPQAPTFAQYGYKVVTYIWRGIFTRSGVPPAALETLNQAIRTTTKSAAWRDYMAKNFQVDLFQSSKEFQKSFEGDVAAAAAYLKRATK